MSAMLRCQEVSTCLSNNNVLYIAGGNDAIFVVGRGDSDFSLHEKIQRDICRKFKNEDGLDIAVLPVKLLQEKAALIIE